MCALTHTYMQIDRYDTLRIRHQLSTNLTIKVTIGKTSTLRDIHGVLAVLRDHSAETVNIIKQRKEKI